MNHSPYLTKTLGMVDAFQLFLLLRTFKSLQIQSILGSQEQHIAVSKVISQGLLELFLRF